MIPKTTRSLMDHAGDNNNDLLVPPASSSREGAPKLELESIVACPVRLRRRDLIWTKRLPFVLATCAATSNLHRAAPTGIHHLATQISSTRDSFHAAKAHQKSSRAAPE